MKNVAVTTVATSRAQCRSIAGITGREYFALSHPVSSLHLHLNASSQDSAIVVVAARVRQGGVPSRIRHSGGACQDVDGRRESGSCGTWRHLLRRDVSHCGRPSCCFGGAHGQVWSRRHRRLALMEALEAAGRRGAEVSFWKLMEGFSEVG